MQARQAAGEVCVAVVSSQAQAISGAGVGELPVVPR
jgi:hypothetical protein